MPQDEGGRERRNPDAQASGGAALHDDIGWLLGGEALVAAPAEILARLCRQLVANGLSIDRVMVTVGTVHPLVMGRSWIWRSWEPDVEALAYGHNALENPAYRDSPNRILLERGGELRYRAVGTDASFVTPFLSEMAAQGVTDYFGLRIPSRDRAWMTFATRAPQGFGDADLARIRVAAAALGVVLEAHVTRDIARTVLETYVGLEAGERVLAGEITRGHYQHRSAVIWLCDLRGFTALSETLDAGAVVALLNDYFERMTVAVKGHGGEILKFVGDAMLAIFPTADGGAAAACSAALAAARDAVAAISAWNAERAERGDEPVRFGIALHMGDVVYGNIGGADRLDFTVIGSAVNRAARIEALTRPLGCCVLASESVAQHAEGLATCGAHRLRDVPDPVELFTLQELLAPKPA